MQEHSQESATITVEAAAHYLGIGRQTAYELARRGELPGARRLGCRIVVSRKVVEAFLEDKPETLETSASE